MSFLVAIWHLYPLWGTSHRKSFCRVSRFYGHSLLLFHQPKMTFIIQQVCRWLTRSQIIDRSFLGGTHLCIKHELLLYTTPNVLGETGQQYLPGKSGNRCKVSAHTLLCIFKSSPNMHPADQMSMGLLQSLSSRIISGARYHLVVTLRVSFTIGFDNFYCFFSRISCYLSYYFSTCWVPVPIRFSPPLPRFEPLVLVFP